MAMLSIAWTGQFAQSNVDGALKAGLWLMLAAVLVVGGLYLARAMRRWSRREVAHAEPFTLQDLREMRARQEIDEREFLALKSALLGRASSDADSARESPEKGPERPGGSSH